MAKQPEQALIVVEATRPPEQADPAANAVKIGDNTFKAVAQVNVPVLSQEDGETVAFRIDRPIREEVNYRDVEAMVNGQKVMTTQENIINIARVTEAYSLSAYDYVMNAMTAGNIKASYPDHSYVGKWFAVTKNGLVPGKRYKQTFVVEMEPIDNAPLAS